MTELTIRVQTDDFDVGTLQRALLGEGFATGAIATFTGHVRSDEGTKSQPSMFLEHYPGMTERCIEAIALEAAGRWPLLAATVVHRVGWLCPGEQIVWVGVASPHREEAFLACEYVMDYLKTRAPLWKKELSADGVRWVDGRQSDEDRAARWSGVTHAE